MSSAIAKVGKETASAPKPGLLGIPYELRCIIWQYYLNDHGDFDLDLRGVIKPEPGWTEPLQLLYTCKQAYEEVRSLYYQRMTIFGPDGWSDVLWRMGSHNIQNVTQLKIFYSCRGIGRCTKRELQIEPYDIWNEVFEHFRYVQPNATLRKIRVVVNPCHGFVKGEMDEIDWAELEAQVLADELNQQFPQEEAQQVAEAENQEEEEDDTDEEEQDPALAWRQCRCLKDTRFLRHLLAFRNVAEISFEGRFPPLWGMVIRSQLGFVEKRRINYGTVHLYNPRYDSYPPDLRWCTPSETDVGLYESHEEYVSPNLDW